MKKYLITGGAGFIGSHLVEALLAAGHEVVVLDNLSTGKRENLNLSVIPVQTGISGDKIPASAGMTKLWVGDICDKAAVAAAMQGVHGVFHLAAVASVTLSIEKWAESHAVNQYGSVIVFDEAAKCNVPVVYASSAAVYGDNENLPLSEKEAPKPLSPYGLDKLACELQAAMGGQCKDLKSVGMRFFNVYGPRQDPKSPYSGVISIFIEKLRMGESVKIYGDGEQSRDFIYVGDVVNYLTAAMQQLHLGNITTEVFNVCTENTVSVKELAILLREISQRQCEISHVQSRAGDIRHSQGNSTKAKNLLKIQANTGLKEGLLTTWQSFC